MQLNRREAARILLPDDIEAGVEFLDQEERESGVIVTLGTSAFRSISPPVNSPRKAIPPSD